MPVEIPFVRQFSFEYGLLEPVAPGIRRIVARNPSPFTFKGTGTYVVGEGQVAVIDPGPDLDEHVAALMAGLAGEQVTHILVTHTHRDHSPAAKALQAATGAVTYGFGPHAGGRRGDDAAVEEGGDWDFVPDVRIEDGAEIVGAGWRFEAVHTPGHTSNHVCFALPERILFSGDHVMGWSTSVIAPPDGDMRAYMASLDKLLGRSEAIYWPTHGPAITAPQPHVRAFIAHRREREAGILDCLARGPQRIEAIVDRLYIELGPGLRRAAGRSVHAHLLDLAARGIVEADGAPTGEAVYRRTRG